MEHLDRIKGHISGLLILGECSTSCHIALNRIFIAWNSTKSASIMQSFQKRILNFDGRFATCGFEVWYDHILWPKRDAVVIGWCLFRLDKNGSFTMEVLHGFSTGCSFQSIRKICTSRDYCIFLWSAWFSLDEFLQLHKCCKKKWVTVFRSQYDAFAYLCNLPYNPNRTRIVAVVGVPPGYLLPTILWMHATLNKEKVNLGGGQTCIHACYGSKSIKMHCDWSVNSMCLGAQMEQAMQN